MSRCTICGQQASHYFTPSAGPAAYYCDVHRPRCTAEDAISGQCEREAGHGGSHRRGATRWNVAGHLCGRVIGKRLCVRAGGHAGACAVREQLGDHRQAAGYNDAPCGERHPDDKREEFRCVLPSGHGANHESRHGNQWFDHCGKRHPYDSTWHCDLPQGHGGEHFNADRSPPLVPAAWGAGSAVYTEEAVFALQQQLAAESKLRESAQASRDSYMEACRKAQARADRAEQASCSAAKQAEQAAHAAAAKQAELESLLEHARAQADAAGERARAAQGQRDNAVALADQAIKDQATVAEHAAWAAHACGCLGCAAAQERAKGYVFSHLAALAAGAALAWITWSALALCPPPHAPSPALGWKACDTAPASSSSSPPSPPR